MFEGQWYLGFIKFCLGDFINARTHIEQVIASYQPDQHHHSLVLRSGVDAGLSAMSYHACCLWCLGYPDQAAQRSQQAISRAHEFDHPFTLADVLSYSGSMFNAMRRDAAALKKCSISLIQLSNEVSLFSGWLGMGTTYLGEAYALEGKLTEAIDTISEGLGTSMSSGVKLYRPIALRALAMTYLASGKPEEALPIIEEALVLVEETSDRTWEAELLRHRGEIFQVLGEEAQAEANFTKSIEIAQNQQAKSWELRATVNLARLWQTLGKSKQAKKMLEEIYDWFTEGYETPDLQDAKSLLDEL